MAEVNRLEELRRAAGKTVEPAEKEDAEMDIQDSKQSSAMAQHVKQYDSIKDGLNRIRRSTAQIEKLKDQETTTVNESARKEIMDELERIMAETTKEGADIKKRLDQIKVENDKFRSENANSAQAQMRLNLYQTHIRRLHQVMNGYNQASHDFKKALKDRTRRQLAIVDPNISADQLEAIVESGHAEEILGEVLISEELDNAVAEIEQRHQGIIKLERQVNEVYQLFQDLATLVDMQQDTLDVIETRISQAKNYQQQALVDLAKGEKYQRSARKKQCCILAIVASLILIIIIFIVYFK